jgi:hypothetical protein
MRRVTRVQVLDGFRLGLTFDNGRSGTVDVSHLAGKGVFSLWLDRKAFEGVRIGESGELVWSDAIDLCPDALYLKATGETADSLPAADPPEVRHA